MASKRIGTVLKRKDGKGNYLVLGNPNAKKFRYTVLVKHIDENGNETVLENPVINFFDPRKSSMTKNPDKIPDYIEFEAVVFDNEDK